MRLAQAGFSFLASHPTLPLYFHDVNLDRTLAGQDPIFTVKLTHLKVGW